MDETAKQTITNMLKDKYGIKTENDLFIRGPKDCDEICENLRAEQIWFVI